MSAILASYASCVLPVTLPRAALLRRKTSGANKEGHIWLRRLRSPRPAGQVDRPRRDCGIGRSPPLLIRSPRAG